MLTFFYRLLSRFKIQDDITEDMQLTFEDARTDARARGWWSYSIFAVKEIGGLLGLPTAERWWLRTAGWGLAGLAAGGIVSYLVPVRYTSESTLRLVPAMVSQDLLPHDTVDVGRLMDIDRTTVLSRSVIAIVINNLDLYPNYRKGEPMEDLVKEFRKSIHIEQSGADLIRVAFAYGDSRPGEDDRILAQKVIQDLDGRLISEAITQRSNSAAATVGFFQDEVHKVGQSWLKASATVKATSVSDPRYELLVLERDQKRKEYESAAQKAWNRRNIEGLGEQRAGYSAPVARRTNPAATTRYTAVNHLAGGAWVRIGHRALDRSFASLAPDYAGLRGSQRRGTRIVKEDTMRSFFRRQLSRVPAAQRWLLRTAGWAVAGLAAGWLVSFILPGHYTSEATLQVVPSTVSQDLLPHEVVDLQSLLDREKPVVTSRNVLTTIVNNFDLYNSERQREPMEDVVEEFRKSVRIELSGTNFIRVAFTYPDRLLANKVTSDLVQRIISGLSRRDRIWRTRALSSSKTSWISLGSPGYKRAPA